MPKIKIDHVVSFSSEDNVHVASNVLLNDHNLKWKCKTAGEKSATLVLQLEKASVISAIDIGNEHSAYIEVLVSRSGTQDDYKVLLVMSSFMSLFEAKQSTNTNKVRMFTRDDLVKPECDQKWDRIKIVCTQPFNRHVQYGLSFINFTSPEDKISTGTAPTFGKFSLRPESPNSLSAGSLFARRKELQDKSEEPLSAAAAIRASTTNILKQSASPISKLKIRESLESSPSPARPHKAVSVDDNDEDEKGPKTSRNRNELLYSADEEKPNEKIDKIVEKKKIETEEKKIKMSEEKKKDSQKDKPKKNSLMDLFSSIDSPSGSSNSPKDSNKRGTNSPKDSNKRKLFEQNGKEIKKLKPSRLTKPFNQLLSNVVIVISGIQNPDRANLRTKALEMGAKYKPDWDDSCTHLICAVKNTPKFNQVRGSGKIITRLWIEECHSQRKFLPWRRYALVKGDKKNSESEDEIWEEEKKTNEINNSSDEEPVIKDDETMESGSDTEERIQRILNSSKKKEDIIDVYEVDTDDEPEVVKPDLKFKELPEFFKNMVFFIDHSFDDDVYRLINKYIAAYYGIKSDDPTDYSIDYFITKQDNCENLKEINEDAVCLRPDWIIECHNHQKLLPTDEFIIM